MFKNELVIDELVRSDRRTLSIMIDKDARLIVRAPKKMTDKAIAGFLKEKRLWILDKQKESLDRLNQRQEILSENGDKVLYLGNHHQLIIEDDYKYALNFSQGNFIIDRKYLQHKSKLMEYWYRQQALKIFRQRLDYFASTSGLTYNSMKINSAQKRWGSCSGRKNLNFSWRLIMAPMSVIDYVIVHELSHTVELNHSAKFWRQVRMILPDYKKEKDWLKTNGFLLDL